MAKSSDDVKIYDAQTAKWVPASGDVVANHFSPDPVAEHMAAKGGPTEPAPGDRTEDEIRELAETDPSVAGPVITSGAPSVDAPSVTMNDTAAGSASRTSGRPR
jgi:hypothetical protein